MNGLDDLLQAKGLSPEVDSQQLGISEEEAAEYVARVLPDVVDQATPGGELPPDDELEEKFGRLHQLRGAAG